MHVASPPGDPRVFVVEQGGVVRVADADGTVRPQPFLDITADTSRDGNERGLLSIAFPPDYTQSGLFYVYLTAKDPLGEIQVREYRRSATDPYVADASGARIVLRQSHAEHANHNGGSMAFGPDGKLWLGVGDGGGGDDPLRAGQDKTTLLGKLLRIEASGAPAAGNPFESSAGGERKEIWAYGLRNPWRFSFDRSTGDLVIADVGQNLREEVDWARAADGRLPGANYGWVCFEGTQPNPMAPPGCQAPGHVPPVHERSHTDGDCSITGGFVVRDAGLPTLNGRYLYGDLCQDTLRSVTLGARDDRAEGGLPVAQVTTFGEDACGRLLVASFATSRVYRIVDGQPSACAATVPPIQPTTHGDPAPRCAPRITAPAGRSIRSVRRSGLRISFALPARCSARVTAAYSRGGAFRTRTFTAAEGTRTVRLRPGRSLGRTLRRGRRGSVRIRVTATGPGGTFVASATTRLR